MPDKTRETLSATQTPALFGASPYLTRWMLLRHFIHGDSIDSPEHNRMDWGRRMQAMLLDQAAEDLRLEVKHNAEDTYIRNGLLGCTRDGDVMCPDRGPGAIETKCVFDFGVWMQTWNGGKSLPRHIEIQLQQQMMVGDGEKPFDWGVLAVWLCGEMKYFERKPIPQLWDAIRKEAGLFFGDVHAGLEGEPFGEQVEAPLLAQLFPVKAGTTVDFTGHPKAKELAEQVRMMAWHSQERSGHEKNEKAIKAMLKALMGEAEEGTFMNGIKVRQKQQSRAGYTVKPTTFTTIEAFVPENAAPAAPAKDTVLVGG